MFGAQFFKDVSPHRGLRWLRGRALQRLLALGSVVFVFCGMSGAAPGSSRPAGIGITMTLEGPVFVDSNGMTLYRLYRSKAGFASANLCSRHRPRAPLAIDDGHVKYTPAPLDWDKRPTCAQQRPPLLAPENAQPVGKWTIVTRDDGTKQWAYDGEPLYKSIKDKLPGDINGTLGDATFGEQSPWVLASVPASEAVDAPPGVGFRTIYTGLALANAAGQVFYYHDRDGAVPDPKLWHPFAAPVAAIAKPASEWSIVPSAYGSGSQWAYQGRPLYTYAYDSDIRGGTDVTGPRAVGDMFGHSYGANIAGWHVVMLKEASGHPQEVKIITIMAGNYAGDPQVKRVYADSRGMTLYTVQCSEQTSEAVECDDVGSDPRYWLSFCGSEERCAATWRPVPAPAAAQPIGNTWSVVTVNPRNPWLPVESGTNGASVWAYRGHPVFTYAGDLRPENHNGYFDAEVFGPAAIKTRPVVAHERE